MANPVIWPKPPECSKGELDRAGAQLKELFTDAAGLDLINQWRSSHGFPLNTVQTGLRSRAKRIDRKTVVAQRLKRFISIQAKLNRKPSMRLSQMQDIGGCRAVVRTMASLRRLSETYLDLDFTKLRDDYIREPKDDGYRSIHLVATYVANDSYYSAHNGQKIEIQLRTQLQHAWATALEVVTTFTNQPLKFGEGDPEWRRFFALMGSVIANREKSPLVPGAEYIDLKELNDHARHLRVIERLRGWRQNMKFLPKRRMVDAEAWVLILNTQGRSLNVRPYKTLAEAATMAAKWEKYKHLDVVQVNAASLDELRSGYRNYYVDTTDFMAAVRRAIRMINRASSSSSS